MFKRALSVITGLIVGTIVVSIGHMACSGINPPPVGLNINDVEGMANYIQSMPTSALSVLITAHVMATFIASWIAARISDAFSFYFGLFVGAVFIVSSIVYDVSLPHPSWMVITDLILTIIATYCGAKLGAGMVKKLI